MIITVIIIIDMESIAQPSSKKKSLKYLGVRKVAQHLKGKKVISRFVNDGVYNTTQLYTHRYIYIYIYILYICLYIDTEP